MSPCATSAGGGQAIRSNACAESGRFDPRGTEDGPAENLERLERCARSNYALARLSEEHRAVLVLREIDGCCYDAIAEVLNVPVGTVRSRLHRARLQMKQELQRIGEGESCDF